MTTCFELPLHLEEKWETKLVRIGYSCKYTPYLPTHYTVVVERAFSKLGDVK